MPSSSLENTQYPTVLAQLREVLLQCQQKSSPRLSQVKIDRVEGEGRREVTSPLVSDVTTKVAPVRTFSSSSQTSIDSTGSTTLERDHGDASAIPNGIGKMGLGHEEKHMTNGHDNTDHMTNGDGHVTESVDHVTNGSIPKQRRPSSVPDAESVFPDLSMSSSPSNGSAIAEEMNGHSEDAPSSPQSPVPPGKKPLARRMTLPSGMTRNSLLTTSVGGISPITRRYANASYQLPGRTMSITAGGGGVSPLGSGRVKIRANPSASISIKRKQRVSTANINGLSVSANLKLVKVVLAGNDILVSHAANAYCHLRRDEPNLFNGLDVRFYHIPLSRASLIHGLNSEPAYSAPSSTSDLPEPLFEQINNSGNDVHIGRFLSHMDSWYERNVMLATHHLLRLVPSVSDSCDVSNVHFC